MTMPCSISTADPDFGKVEIPCPADVVRDLRAYRQVEIADAFCDALHNLIAGKTYHAAIVDRRLNGASADHLIDDLIHEIGNSDWAREQWVYFFGDAE